LITDFDAGLEGMPNIEPVTANEVARVFNENNDKVKKVIFKMVEKIGVERNCSCKDALKTAFI
jgi:5'-methylthioadenosine phosphorylase